MPKVIDYAVVLAQLRQQGLKSLYHNSGAFWFLDGVETFSRGWIGAADASISETATPLVRHAAEPFAENLASLLVQFWQRRPSGAIWIMPKSHWAYELQFGSREWLAKLLEGVGIDSGMLSPLNHAAAIEFEFAESARVQQVVQALLDHLVGSDFQLVFADCRTICTIHSRTQLWWTTVDAAVAAELDLLLPT
jgi:hypothetical protein